jgi:hypothetical protein
MAPAVPQDRGVAPRRPGTPHRWRERHPGLVKHHDPRAPPARVFGGFWASRGRPSGRSPPRPARWRGEQDAAHSSPSPEGCATRGRGGGARPSGVRSPPRSAEGSTGRCRTRALGRLAAARVRACGAGGGPAWVCGRLGRRRAGRRGRLAATCGTSGGRSVGRCPGGGDLGLGGAALVHAGGAQAQAFHALEVAPCSGWAACRGCGHRPLLPQPGCCGDYGMQACRPIWRTSLASRLPRGLPRGRGASPVTSTGLVGRLAEPRQQTLLLPWGASAGGSRNLRSCTWCSRGQGSCESDARPPAARRSRAERWLEA